MKAFTADSATGTINATTEKPQKDRPIADRFISIGMYGSILYAGPVTDDCVGIARHYTYISRHGILEKLCMHSINSSAAERKFFALEAQR